MILNQSFSNPDGNNLLWEIPQLSEVEINSYLHFAQRIILEVGGLIREGYYRHKEIASKDGRELVTSADIASEKFLHSQILATYPDHKILSEELSDSQGTDVENLWVIDPLDGTNNFAHGFPFFAISIAFIYRGNLVLGVVHDPLREEIFWATSLSDAYLNGEKIVVSSAKNLSESIIATGFPYDLAPDTENNLNYFIDFSYASQGLRRAGSAALDLCYVAASRLDGFWELKLRPWDMAAGTLIVKKAGGIVTDFDGKPWRLNSDRIVAANPEIHSQMLSIINKK
ncbi:inositol monophosphatase [bacterium]|nr:MAG: inositol monophosphatase [bacterium]